MTDISTRITAQVSLSVDLAPEDYFEHQERWGGRRKFRIKRLYLTGDPRLGVLDNSVGISGPNLKQNGEEGQQRIRYSSVSLDSLPEHVQRDIAIAFGDTIKHLSDQINEVRSDGTR